MASELTSFLQQKYGAHASDRITEIEEYWRIYKPYSEPGFAASFCTNDPELHQQRYWELWLGARLLRQGLQLKPNPGYGPDFGFDHDGRRIWIEAISPTAGRGANRVPEPVYQTEGAPLVTYDVPADQILLRYTAGVREKLLKYKTYIADGTVSEGDCLVIAIDGGLMSHWGTHGKSTFPHALEAVYPVGNLQVQFPIGRTGPVTTSSSYRPMIQNANLASIATNVFLQPENSFISGVLAGCEAADVRVIPPRRVVFVHNKLARKPLDPLPIIVNEEYQIQDAPNGYDIRSTDHGPVRV